METPPNPLELPDVEDEPQEDGDDSDMGIHDGAAD